LEVLRNRAELTIDSGDPIQDRSASASDEAVPAIEGTDPTLDGTDLTDD
jgi:hypothetical protein